jgi:Arabinose efflux permease
MKASNKLYNNIKVSYLYSFVMELNITTAVWVLYLSYKGMSLIQIGLLESIFHITGLLFELPTGAIADLYGKKFSVVTGRIFSIISCILMIISESFWGFALAFVITAASYNMNSGAAEALVYDSLKTLGDEDKYKKIWGHLNFLMSIAQGIAILLGGILSDIRFIYAYLLGLILQTAALVISLRFIEPPSEKTDEMSESNAVIRQVKTSIKVLRKRPVVLYLILFSALVSSLGTTVYFYSQKYFENMEYTKTAIALIFAASSLLSAVSSKLAHRIESFLKQEGVLLAAAALNVFALLGLAFLKDYSILFFTLTSITDGAAYPIFSDYINSRIPSEYRATLLSFDSLSFSIFMIGIFPLFGFAADKISFSFTFGAAGLLYVPLMAILILKIKQKSTEK